MDSITTTVNAIPSPNSKKIHEAKAITNTWLAWQKKPGLGFANLFKEGLIDEGHKNYKDFVDWMSEIFQK